MKIAIITKYWINSPGGGVREYTKNLVNALKEKGVDVTVIFREGKDDDNYKMPENKVKFTFRAKKILEKEKPDTILAQGGWFTEIPAYLYKRKHPETKIAVLFHTQFGKRLPAYKRIFYNILINKFDKIGFVSKALEENVKNVAGLKIKKDTFILYAGAKVSEVKKEDIGKFRKQFSIPSDTTILLGQSLTAHKLKAEGAKLLVDAVKILNERGRKVTLILTREGRFSPMLKKYAEEKGVSRDVIFTGDVENPLVPLALCDIYTHITLGEGGLSVALLEAMAMGKPIIATPVGGIPEAIEDGVNGILVEPNAEKIAEKVGLLLRNPQMARKLGENAKKTAVERFRWERTAEDLINDFKSNLKESFNKKLDLLCI